MTPAAIGLTREQIVAAAITLLDAEGVDSFSMRRLGAALGADPMSIYHHIPTKAALFDAVVDAVWAEIAGDRAAMGASWRDIVADIARGLRGHLLAHPNLVALVATRPAVTPSMLGLIDESLGRLADAGSRQRRPWSCSTVSWRSPSARCRASSASRSAGRTPPQTRSIRPSPLTPSRTWSPR